MTNIETQFESLTISSDLTVEEINNRIDIEKDESIIESLNDKNMYESYINSPSVIRRIDILRSILEKNEVNEETINSILYEYTNEIIPPSTKGVLKGNKFNNIIKEHLELILKDTALKVFFETCCPIVKTDEIPDWYIIDESTNKVMIGMNQLDLWGGGHQFNRGSKYVIDNKINTDKVKLLAVVCNYVKLKTNKNKIYKLFNVGFNNDTLCYIGNIKNIIYSFFNQEHD